MWQRMARRTSGVATRGGGASIVGRCVVAAAPAAAAVPLTVPFVCATAATLFTPHQRLLHTVRRASTGAATVHQQDALRRLPSCARARCFSTAAAGDDANGSSNKDGDANVATAAPPAAAADATTAAASAAPPAVVPVRRSVHSSLGQLAPYGDANLYFQVLEMLKAHRAALVMHAKVREAESTTHALSAAEALEHAQSPIAKLLVPVLPYGRPLLPGMKTELRIPRLEVAEFLAHLRSRAEPPPKYMALFYRLPPPSIDVDEPATAQASPARADDPESPRLSTRLSRMLERLGRGNHRARSRPRSVKRLTPVAAAAAKLTNGKFEEVTPQSTKSAANVDVPITIVDASATSTTIEPAANPTEAKAEEELPAHIAAEVDALIAEQEAEIAALRAKFKIESEAIMANVAAEIEAEVANLDADVDFDSDKRTKADEELAEILADHAARQKNKDFKDPFEVAKANLFAELDKIQAETDAEFAELAKAKMAEEAAAAAAADAGASETKPTEEAVVAADDASVVAQGTRAVKAARLKSDALMSSPSALSSGEVARRAGLRGLLSYVHPTGVVVELLGLADDKGNMSTRWHADLESQTHLVLHVLVLDRCGVEEVVSHPAGFLTAKVALIPEPSFISTYKTAQMELRKTPESPEARKRVEEVMHIEKRTKELYKAVTDLIQLHGEHERPAGHGHGAHRAMPKPNHVYDLTRPTSIADHAVSLTHSRQAQVQRVLHEQDTLARVELAMKLVLHDQALLKAQAAIRATVAQTQAQGLTIELLEQQRANVMRKQTQMDLDAQAKADAEKPKTSTDGAASADAESASSSASTSTTVDPKKSPKEQVVDRLLARLEGKVVPPEVRSVLDDEAAKYLSMDSEHSSGAHSARHYLDWLTVLPWGVHSPESLDLRAAEAVLDREHHAMQEVKNQILEIIAINLLKQKQSAALAAAAAASTDSSTTPSSDSSSTPSSSPAPAPIVSHASGKILCLVGPPGVGKTSIGRSVANALGRSFQRISVGGLSDVSEIKGHRRTYMGALPGCVVRALKLAGVANPVVLLDEIDKLGAGGARGDPAAALLEVLDPEQNSTFTDHFLDVGLDLSRVLFVCTANNADAIPGPLRDRMEFIHVSGYTASEKLAIARRHLIPHLHTATGVREEDLRIGDSALGDLVRWYAREPGVRGLQKLLEKLFRKVALRMAKQKQQLSRAAASTTAATTTTPAEPLVVIEHDNLLEYVGQRKYARDRMYDSTPVGVVMGLGYSEHGGSTIFIEATCANSTDQHQASPVIPSIPTAAALMPSGESVGDDADTDASPFGGGRGGGFFCTGSLGAVMKESSSIAYTVSKRFLARYAPSRVAAFQSQLVHIHLPTGSTPKDGPSAGITLTCALLSLALRTPVAADLAMTGELTLTGQVTPVGGLKEKLLAAKRARVTQLVVPAGNAPDIHEIEQQAPELLEGVTVHFARTFDDIMPIAFPHLEKEAVPLTSLPRGNAAPSAAATLQSS